ncbi:unnamed protein product [Amoebophrya sp. A25]|nr:unnamed protein product [Amoebophrya sp. A25]|eukprot:GSA25T00023223001.1
MVDMMHRQNPIAAGPADTPLFAAAPNIAAEWMCVSETNGFVTFPKCNTVNIAKRRRCKKCGSERPPEERTDFARNSSIFRKTDWKCGQCSNINWEWRASCNKCGQLKPSVSIELYKQREAARALRKPEEGRGGGYYDRQDPLVGRIEHDDEGVDDFGRKKRDQDHGLDDSRPVKRHRWSAGGPRGEAPTNNTISSNSHRADPDEMVFTYKNKAACGDGEVSEGDGTPSGRATADQHLDKPDRSSEPAQAGKSGEEKPHQSADAIKEDILKGYQAHINVEKKK